jgi:aspartoacylase
VKAINHVVIAGGTHGNEFTGVFLLKQWQKAPQQVTRTSFKTELLYANPQAITNNKRFIDNDLNRCFSYAQLNDYQRSSTEDDRAKVINQQIGPKGSAKADFIIDLHTTTANMGVNIVFTKLDRFHLGLAAYLLEKMDNVTITLEDSLGDDHHFLCAIADKHCIIEVGPVPQGLFNHFIIEQTDMATRHILDFVEHNNQDSLPTLKDTIDVYKFVDVISLPLDQDGTQSAMVHKSIQGKDFQMIHEGEPMLQTTAGEVIYYHGPSRYMAFINEAAYYVKGIAFQTLEKMTFKRSDYQ